jgi:sugar phosphate isomerase/epimerase
MTEWILWTGTVGMDKTIPQRIEAALAGGYTHTSLSLHDVKVAEEQGTNARELGRMMRDQGVSPTVLDAIGNWLPSSKPHDPSRPTVEDGLAMAEDLEVRSVSLIGMRPSPLPIEELAEHVGVMCDRGAKIGVNVHIEFAPQSAIPSLTAAWDLVRLADRPNGGILFDTWHFFRSGSDIAMLDVIPGDKIMAVQISDATPEIEGTLYEDTLHRRRLPGDGCIDLPPIIRALHRSGGLSLVGPETFSDELHALGATDAAMTASARERELFDRVLGPGWND